MNTVVCLRKKRTKNAAPQHSTLGLASNSVESVEELTDICWDNKWQMASSVYLTDYTAVT